MDIPHFIIGVLLNMNTILCCSACNIEIGFTRRCSFWKTGIMRIGIYSIVISFYISFIKWSELFIIRKKFKFFICVFFMVIPFANSNTKVICNYSIKPISPLQVYKILYTLFYLLLYIVLGA